MTISGGQSKRRVALVDMTPDELEVWLSETREALLAKMARERAYLARRARRASRTPTDEAYARDLTLEADSVARLEEMLAQVPRFRAEWHAP